MRFTREIGRLLLLFLFAYGGVAVGALYWAVNGADGLLLREDNPRLIERNTAILRGALYDRHGALLAESTPQGRFGTRRTFFDEATYSALGYFSFRYGAGGIEQGFNPLLRGDSLPFDWGRYIAVNWLHRRQVGVDLQLALDAGLQTELYTALAGERGAGVMLDVATGDVLALVSLPTYDPNTLDADWATLVQDESNPFFNRVLQGAYQAGGVLQVPLLAFAQLNRYDVQAVRPQADAPVRVQNLVLTCALAPDEAAMSLLRAFAFGCPAPFDALLSASNPAALEAFMNVLALSQLPPLDFLVPLANPPAVQAEQSLGRDDWLGQGQVRVNPLALARLMAAIAGSGNAPAVRFARALRPPDASEWQPLPYAGSETPMMPDSTAQQVRQWLTDALNAHATQPVRTWGGHVALAFSGEGQHVWFAGFGAREGRTVALVFVLENNADARDALARAQRLLAP